MSIAELEALAVLVKGRARSAARRSGNGRVNVRAAKVLVRRGLAEYRTMRWYAVTDEGRRAYEQAKGSKE